MNGDQYECLKHIWSVISLCTNDHREIEKQVYK